MKDVFYQQNLCFCATDRQAEQREKPWKTYSPGKKEMTVV